MTPGLPTRRPVVQVANTRAVSLLAVHLLRADGGAPLGLREVLSSEASLGYLAGGVILGACWRARAMLVIAVSPLPQCRSVLP